MNYRQIRELEAREQRREMILRLVCPHCAEREQVGRLMTNPGMEEISPKFHWFTCGRCMTTMGVQKREQG